ncbi:MAG: hypothetical protein BA870_03085 [Desulfuromonadales bacterium C00003094]|jgi:hypothetical protein|nr:MAG: hypothetical protein BA870_03085 [Desulfuromonadales bacterium C00003094]OEU72271.1 MAG: hypothetical protein BA869_04595 [Desulfuromonadales bacterium C00003107]
MTQQINLYQSAVFIRTSPFAARRLLLAVTVGVGLLLLGYGVARWQLWRTTGHLADLTAQEQAAQQRIVDLQQSYPVKAYSETLARQVTQLRAEKAARLPLLTLLVDHSPDEFPGFSEHLQGLAREDLAGVWLRDVVLADGGHSLVLQGSALRAELVPRYVKRLSRQPSFAGLEFASLVMSRSEDRKEAVDFVLRSTVEEAQ